MLFSIFSKITRQKTLSDKISHHQSGVYVVLLFPITVAFLLTFLIARLISHIDPHFYIQIVEDLHIHHYAYGIFILSVSGYLALAATKPRHKYLISLMHGVGLGMAFDEFGLWLRLTDETTARFSYDGALILGALFFLLVSAETGIKAWQSHFSRKPKGPNPAPDPIQDTSYNIQNTPSGTPN